MDSYENVVGTNYFLCELYVISGSDEPFFK